MRIVVTGATGFIGPRLLAVLRERGDEVTVLARNAASATTALGVPAIAADLEAPGPWQASLAGADAVVHLAGEPISGRWDARKKQRIRDSRVESTRMIVESIAALPAADRPRVLVTASGIDYYAFGDPDLELGDDDAADQVTEADPAGDHFLARVCRSWETEARAADALGVRTVQTRFGLVLGPGGGPLGAMLRPFRFGLGGRMGTGKQYWSWIHRDDVVRVLVLALDDTRVTGPINAVSPTPTRQAAFARALGAALHRPTFLPAPAFAIRAALGEFAEYLLSGRPAVPTKLLALGFTFTRPTLTDALRDAGADA